MLLGFGLVLGPVVHWDQPVPEGLVIFIALEGGHIEAAEQVIVALGHLCLGVLHYLNNDDNE